MISDVASNFTDRTPAVPTWLLWLAGATVLLPTLNCLQRGQVGILLTYLLLLGFRCVLTSRFLWSALLGGIVLALPIAIKIIPALPVGCLCLLLLAVAAIHRWPAVSMSRAVGALSGVAAGLLLYFVVIPSVAVGPAANAKYLNTWFTAVLLDDQGKSDDDISAHALRNQSLSNAVYRMGNWAAHAFAGAPDDQSIDNLSASQAARRIILPMDAVWVKWALRAAQLGLLALLLYSGWTAARCDDPWVLAAFFALSCLLISAISPVFRGHYYMLWLPAVWIVPLYDWRNGRSRLAITLAVSACALVWIHYLFLPWAGRAGILGLGATIWYVVATVSLVRISRGVAAKCDNQRLPLRQAA